MHLDTLFMYNRLVEAIRQEERERILSRVNERPKQKNKPGPKPRPLSYVAKPKPLAKGKPKLMGRPPGKATKPNKPSAKRRTAAEMEKLSKEILAYVTKKPDQKISTIAEAFGLLPREARRPLTKMIKDKIVVRKGEKHDCTYSAKA